MEKLKQLCVKLDNNWPLPQFSLLIAWVSLILLSLIVVDDNLHKIINHSFYTKLAALSLIQGVAWLCFYQIPKIPRNK